ncbi:MAG: DMT family transporter, partial [bacterium]|nr:DMT family transporter [bacterium]
ILLSIALIKRERIWCSRRQLGVVAFSAFLFAVNLFIYHKNIGYVGGGIATLLGNFQVFVLAGYGVIVLKEKLNLKLIVAIPLALFGISMIIGFEWSGLAENLKMGLLFGCMGALVYGLFLISLRKSQKEIEPLSPIVFIAMLSIMCSIMLAVMSKSAGESLSISGFQTVGSLIAYGIVGQVTGHIFLTKGISNTAPSKAGLLHLLQPALVYIWDIMIFSRIVNPAEMAGFIIAMGAV